MTPQHDDARASAGPVVVALPSLRAPKGVCTGCLGAGECWICDGAGCHRCAVSGTCHLCRGTGRLASSPTPSQRTPPREELGGS